MVLSNIKQNNITNIQYTTNTLQKAKISYNCICSVTYICYNILCYNCLKERERESSLSKLHLEQHENHRVFNYNFNIHSTVVPVILQTLDEDIIGFCSYFYAFDSTFKNISNANSFGAITSIKKENTNTYNNTLYYYIYSILYKIFILLSIYLTNA